jgi:predicted deacylase
MADEVIKIRDITVEPGAKEHVWITIGQMLDGSPYRIPLILINGKKPGPKLLVGACVHGDEVIGTEAIKTVAKTLTPDDISGWFIGAPITNIASYLSLARVDLLETPIGENNMSAKWRTGTLDGSMTERAAAFFRDEVISLAEYYVEIHSSAQGSFNSPRAIICGDYAEIDPVVRKRVDEIGVACNFEVIFKPETTAWKGMYFPPSTFFEESGVAKIVLETGAAPTITDVETIREGIRNIMKQTKMIPGEPNLKNEQTYCGRLMALRADSGGIFRATAQLRDRVKQGDKLGEVTDVFDNVIEEIIAPADGIVVKIATTAAVYSGIRLLVLSV